MTKSDFEKAMEKLSDEDFRLELEQMDLSDKQSQLNISRTSVNRREIKLKKEFLSEQQPNLSLVR